jgi:hypothetical protein
MDNWINLPSRQVIYTNPLVNKYTTRFIWQPTFFETPLKNYLDKYYKTYYPNHCYENPKDNTKGSSTQVAEEETARIHACGNNCRNKHYGNSNGCRLGDKK